MTRSEADDAISAADSHFRAQILSRVGEMRPRNARAPMSAAVRRARDYMGRAR